MGTRRHKPCIPRHWEAPLPPRIEDYVGEEHWVRAIDAFVAALDLEALGFQHAGDALGRGQPAFHPGALLMRDLYGYVERVHRSRRLERECRRNLEAMWLLPEEGAREYFHNLGAWEREERVGAQWALV